ncbi:MAG TPA: L-serine ammonia-lyase [Terriglobales bacterium]
MKTSIFEIFKIGIGPSSSHTVGPMRAARRFGLDLQDRELLGRTSRVQVELFGSLALTGQGHATDRAVLLGLSGEEPERVDPASVAEKVGRIRAQHDLRLLDSVEIPFHEEKDLLFLKTQILPGHSNGMRFTAFDQGGSELYSAVFYSVGGGFIAREGEDAGHSELKSPPFPFSSADQLLEIGDRQKISIWQIVLENEKTWRTETQVRSELKRIWEVMQACVNRGLVTEGILPGGLNVRRRAPRLSRKLKEQGGSDPLAPMDWVNVYAMAVNEENAAGGQVVTAPTNGAAGIIPAVAHYYQRFVEGASDEGLFRYFLTAGAIGILYKENASISGAEVGCQGEVGVACSMAAGGLVAAQGGSNRQVEYAAEIGMEHNLGMTCDPIGGLVQIPCIERNAMGSVKAINASRIAMREMDEHKVSLDQVIATMYQTGLDMQSRYKETSLAGLALNVIEC